MARRRRALVVEDDYDAEFRYDREPVRALQGLDPERVAYLGTTSKTLAPALRLGWLVVPVALADEAERIKHLLDVCSPPLDQLALARFIGRGHYDRHVRRARAVYRGRRDRLLAALDAELPGLAAEGVAAGLHVLLRLPPGVDDREVAAEAERDGVRVTPLSTYELAPSGQGGLVIGYGRIHEDALRPAVAALARALRRTRASAERSASDGRSDRLHVRR
jgi:GntR family transcriptional regulator / MocR family aminotransferase